VKSVSAIIKRHSSAARTKLFGIFPGGSSRYSRAGYFPFTIAADALISANGRIKSFQRGGAKHIKPQRQTPWNAIFLMQIINRRARALSIGECRNSFWSEMLSRRPRGDQKLKVRFGNISLLVLGGRAHTHTHHWAIFGSCPKRVNINWITFLL
jgi:hypothetical protein